MTNYFTDKQIHLMAAVLQKSLIDVGVSCTALIDISGNIIVQKNNVYLDEEIKNMAILAAGNFSAITAIATRIGEGDFSLLVHKGKKGNIYINTLMNEYLLMTIFGKEPSVGVLRIKVKEAINKIQAIQYKFQEREMERAQPPEIDSPTFRFSNLRKALDRRIVFALRKKIKYRLQGYLTK